MQGSAGAVKALQSDVQFAIGPEQVAGRKLTWQTESDRSRAALYFFETPQWVVTVRTRAQATDAEANTPCDEFVRALRWNTLGTDPGNLHGG